MDFTSKGPNDCAVVAISAVLGKTWHEVARELGYLPKDGVKTNNLSFYLFTQGFTRKPIPRRGQEKMTGFVRLASYSKSKSGHLVAILCGRVYDANHPQGVAIDIYRQVHQHNHITHYWVKEVDIMRLRSVPNDTKRSM